MNPSNRNRFPKPVAHLHMEADELFQKASRLEGLLTRFHTADKEFNSTPSDAAWGRRTRLVARIRSACRCSPSELPKAIATIKAQADRISSEAKNIDRKADDRLTTALLENAVGRKLGVPTKVKPAQNPPGTRRLAA